MNKTASPRADIYQTVTDSIVAAIEAGAGDWRMPWHVKPGDAAAARRDASPRIQPPANAGGYGRLAAKCCPAHPPRGGASPRRRYLVIQHSGVVTAGRT